METETDAGAAVDGDALGTEPDPEASNDSLAPNPEIERLTSERDALRARLIEAEQALAELPKLRAAQEELATMRSSVWWRVTAPLRRATASAWGALRPRARLALKRAVLRLAPRLLR